MVMESNARKLAIFVALEAVLLLAATGANADTTGADLSGRCDSAQNLIQGGVVDTMSAVTASQCVSFVDGLTIGLQIGALLDESGRSYCPPKDFTSSEAIATVQEFFLEYPELSGEEAGILAADALITAYPCPSRLNAQAAMVVDEPPRGPLDQ
jgi:hypothetical protein